MNLILEDVSKMKFHNYIIKFINENNKIRIITNILNEMWHENLIFKEFNLKRDGYKWGIVENNNLKYKFLTPWKKNQKNNESTLYDDYVQVIVNRIRIKLRLVI